MNILIAEDEKSLGRLFKMMLQNALPDCRPDVVESGEEVVEAFRKGRYDILMLDIQMPGKDGYQAFQEVREVCRESSREMPFVLFCTGYEVSAELENQVANGSRCRILRKPFINDKLIEIITTWSKSEC
jgi:CheY-like chemotaxis protein